GPGRRRHRERQLVAVLIWELARVGRGLRQPTVATGERDYVRRPVCLDDPDAWHVVVGHAHRSRVVGVAPAVGEIGDPRAEVRLVETADDLVLSRCTDADGLTDIPVARGEGELRVVESEQVRAAVVEGDGYVGRGRRRQPHLDVVIVGPDTGIADGHVCGAAAFHDHDRRLRG